MSENEIDLTKEACKLVISAVDMLSEIKKTQPERFLDYAPAVLRMIIDYINNI